MKKFILLILTLTVCLGGFAQFTPGDILEVSYQPERQWLLPLFFAKAGKVLIQKVC